MQTCILFISKMPNHYQIILCSCPDKDSAEEIAHSLVNARLAACVNIVPGVTSVYLWHETIESAQEHLLLIKACQSNYQDIESLIKQLHAYELPEIIAVSIENGSPEYLRWIDSCHS